MSVTGTDPEHPVKTGLSIADVLAGVHAALGIVAALHERASTGRGQVVRTSLLASIVGAHAFQGTRWTVARNPGSNRQPSSVDRAIWRSTGARTACSRWLWPTRTNGAGSRRSS